MRKGEKVTVPDPPLRYAILQWARDMNISYAQALEMPEWVMESYLEMRDLEIEYGSETNVT